MKTIEIIYNPYKMETKMIIDEVDVCQNRNYEKFKTFVENKIPLQTWIEPIEYLDWAGFVNEISDTETNDQVEIIFSGRVIDFKDLERAISVQNMKRSKETRVIYTFCHKRVLDDKVLSKNIEEVVAELKSDRFRELVALRTTDSLTQRYNKLEENYRIAKENVFYIVFSGAYSSGKSTLLNTIIRHEVLPTSSRTCTSKNCRIRHDGSLGKRVSLACYDEDDNIVGKRMVFDTDYECAQAFLKICPSEDVAAQNKPSDIATMEIGADLSHLYPDSVNKNNFTIVLVDTPGVDSAKSSEDGENRHAEIALEAISMESRPMIVFCADANYYDNKNIGEFMREIVDQAKEDSGFNDRFLFLMNKSDAINYNQGETAEQAKMKFAEYLTDSSKWNIKGDEKELRRVAENASHFVPRVFMTTSLAALAIKMGAFDFTDDELDDPHKEALYESLESFAKKVCDRKRVNFYLSRYCDIPAYRRDGIEAEFKKAVDDGDKIRATELQCGLVCVESAIRDYIERYAYPIKVRGLLDTFESTLEDVDGFTNGILADLKQKEKDLGEKSGERREARTRKKSAKEKIAALEKAKEKINAQKAELNKIQFDSNSLKLAEIEFKADINGDEDIRFIRENPTVKTGQKSRSEVEREINDRILRIKDLFSRTLKNINNKLQEIQKGHDDQINEVYGVLKSAVLELENSGVFSQGEYKFTDSVIWKMNFANINSRNFVSDMQKKIVDKSEKEEWVRRKKKNVWQSSRNPFKRLFSFLVSSDKYIDVYTTRKVDGCYKNDELVKGIDEYFVGLEEESKNMEERFTSILQSCKDQVEDLIEKLLDELRCFLVDIKNQEERIEKLGESIDDLKTEIKKNEETNGWLKELSEKIKGV